MPQQITAAVLGSINNGLNLSYNTQLYATTTQYGRFTYDASSTGAAEVYPRLDMLKGLREWVGPREVQSLQQLAFTITNRTFEQTIAVKREDIEDDKYGVYSQIAQQMGQNAARLPDLLIAQLMKAGTTTPIYDGQNFFDAAHPTFAADGSATTVGNYTSGSGAGWYLIDNSQVLKPFIFQRRRAFNLVTRFSLTDPAVFDSNEFVWGVDGRANAGFGLWQLAYYSKAALTPANLVAARTAMANIRRPDGTPMGITPTLLVVPSTLYPQAKSYYENGLVAQDPASPTTLTDNTVRGLFEPIEFRWLN